MKNKYSNITVNSNDSILFVLKKMDMSHRKLLMVEENNRYVSLISIGDVQRALIANIDINSPIKPILRKKVNVARDTDDLEQIKTFMRERRTEFMPVLSSSGELINVLFWEDLFDIQTNIPLTQFNAPVVIMAGGLGTRLKPLTNVLPKPLIPIGDKTIIEEIFDRFGKHGCENFYISVNYKSDLIEFYLTNQELPYHLSFFKEIKPMGTAGSLSLLKSEIKETFFVSNCDILIEQDYAEILEYHRSNKNEITIVAALKHFPIAYGTIETGENGKLVRLQEKPELTFKINSGMYVLEPHLLYEIPDNEFFHITDLIDNIIKRGGAVGVFPVTEKSWKDIGSWEELKQHLV